MAEAITISVPSTSEAKSKGKIYTIYHINVTVAPDSFWVVNRRYNEFYELHVELKKLHEKHLKGVKFPEKKYFTRLNEKVIQTRRISLEAFVQKVVAVPELICLPVVRTFLSLDRNGQPQADTPPLDEDDEPAASAPAGTQQFAKALYDFEGRNEDELSLKYGDIVVVLEKPDDNGWMYGQSHGQSGYFPANYVEIVDEIPEGYLQDKQPSKAPALPNPAIPAQMDADEASNRRKTVLLEGPAVDPIKTQYKQARALYDYTGQDGTYELTFRTNDIIHVLEEEEADGWWQGELNGVIGYFPGNYVEIMEQPVTPPPATVITAPADQHARPASATTSVSIPLATTPTASLTGIDARSSSNASSNLRAKSPQKRTSGTSVASFEPPPAMSVPPSAHSPSAATPAAPAAAAGATNCRHYLKMHR